MRGVPIVTPQLRLLRFALKPCNGLKREALGYVLKKSWLTKGSKAVPALICQQPGRDDLATFFAMIFKDVRASHGFTIIFTKSDFFLLVQ